MRPVLLTWRGRHVHSYPVFLYLAMVSGITAADQATRVTGLENRRVLLGLVLLTIPALLGARLLFVAGHRELTSTYDRRRRRSGGAAVQGGLVLAMATSVPLLTVLELPHAAFWDAAAIGGLVGVAIGRVGCLLHGCCSGRPSASRWALHLPDHRGIRQRRVPTQLMDAAWATVLLIFSASLLPHRPFPGAVFLIALAGYSAGRFAFEPMRESRRRVLGPLYAQQLLSAALGLAALGGLTFAGIAGRLNL